MSNFQRTRSKVWWGDSPPNIGSPLPRRVREERDDGWEPQLPRWAGAEEPEEEEQGVAEGNETPPLARHASPNSHKSQDSGFSDSDSSPPQAQAEAQIHTPPPSCHERPQDDQLKTPNSAHGACYRHDTPVRSIIKTPRDLHNYLEAHCDVGHVVFDSVRQDTTAGNPIRVIITPHKNINNNNILVEKCTRKRNLLEKFNEDQDERSCMEYIEVAPNQTAAVDNQPGVRSPLDYSRLDHHQENPRHFHSIHYFKRQGLNRSFHSTLSTQRVDEQILDEGSHSLGYIELHRDEEDFAMKQENQIKLFSTRKITDSLHLKKSMIKTKQKIQHKASKIRQNKGIFNFMPKKNESIKTIYDITKDSERIPTLGLFHDHENNKWKDYEYGMQERYVDVENTPDLSACQDYPKGILKTPGTQRKITPPQQFQDKNNRSRHLEEYEKPSHELMRKESSSEDLYFSEQDLSGMCTSTPKSSVPETSRLSNMKPTNLLYNFNRTIEKSHEIETQNGDDSEVCVTALERVCQGKEAPLQQWLCSLVGATEGEVGTLLQSKPIGRLEHTTISHASHTITGNIRKVHTHALLITHTAISAIKNLESDDKNVVKQKCSEMKSVAASMNEFIMTHSITLKIRPPKESPDRWEQISAALEQNIQRAEEICEDINIELNETNPETRVLKRHFISLHDLFSETTRAVLVQQMKTLVGLLEDPPSDTMLKSTLTSLGQLGRCAVEAGVDNAGICRVPLVQCGVPRALLELIIHSNKSSIKALSLRALATICTSSEAVEQFDQAGGLEIVCEVLQEQGVPEPQVREAVTVLAQVTAPWLRGHYTLPSLHTHLGTIIQNLTRILSETLCCQLLLLCAAALVNVVRSVRREGRAAAGVIATLREHRTLDMLLEAVKKRGPHASVFLQEQTAALLDLVTCCAGGRVLVCECPTSCVALLCFLRPTPPATPRPSLTAISPLHQAELRLLTHTAEALARLCTIPELCEKVIQLEGPSRLVRVILSKPPRAPLTPLLRALRSLHHALPSCLPPHTQRMIQLPLMDAVSYYQQHSNHESYDMSNFQRTRSKVWWGDSPPNIGSPLPRRVREERDDGWEPQLPRWAGAEEPEEEEQGVAEGNETPPLARHASPNSHKSQDSGFSDSDSSPPQAQAEAQIHTPPPSCHERPQDDQLKTPNSAHGACYRHDTPVRSIIKTPRDLHNYLEAHCDVGHVVFDSVRQDTTAGNPIRVIITPHKNINNNNILVEKCTRKRNLLEKFNEDQDERSCMEYIEVAPNQTAAVDNQPGVRSPLDYSRLDHHQENPRHFHSIHYFKRQGLNRSFHSTLSTQRVDEQILDEGSHSLGYIELHRDEEDFAMKQENQIKLFSTRKITDSLHLKKSMIKTKQKIQHKASKIRQNKGIFNFMPKKNESIKTIYDITKDSERIPTLGLFHDHENNKWKDYEYGMQERYVDVENTPDLSACQDYPKGILKTPGTQRKITPPQQFQDKNNRSRHLEEYEKPSHELMRKESSSEDLYFSEQDLSGMCTSTPKSSVPETSRLSNMKPTNLLYNFNRTIEKSHEIETQNGDDSEVCVTALERVCQGKEAPLQQWLCSLVGATEGEVGTLLQSKPIGRLEHTTISHASHTITGNIRKVHTHALLITHTAISAIKNLESDDKNVVKQKCSEMKSVAASMNEFIMTHSITLKIRPPKESPDRWEQISAALEQNIQRAEEICEDINIELNETNPETRVLKRHFISLHDLFSETTRAVLVQQMKTLVGLLEDPPSDTMLKSTLTSLGQLGRCAVEAGVDNAGICRVPLVQCGVPRALLELIIHSNKSSIKALSLRALATICTSSEAVEQFDQAGGLEIVCEVLQEQGVPEPQVREAVTVLAQVTAPWLRGHYTLPSLHTHLGTIIQNLTRILSETLCCQLLLLCAAALVNVVRSVRREGRAAAGVIATLREHRTLDMLLEAVKKRGPHASVFLQEQTAALLDLVTCCAGGRVLVCECPTSCVALLCFLRPTPPATPRPSLTAISPLHQAELRLLTHTAEALARLCTIPELCEKVIQLEGPSRLVRVILSKPPRAPLTPLLRALRSLHHALPSCLPPHTQRMIQLPLMDAVSYYQQHSNHESYV